MKHVSIKLFLLLGMFFYSLLQSAPLAYVSNQSDNTVSVIDLASNTVIATIDVGTTPAGLATSPDGASVYVANIDDATITPITVATNKTNPTISTGNRPDKIAISPDGQFLYVTNSSDNTVSKINLATTATDASINVGLNPLGIAITPDGTTALVTNYGDNSVTKINLANNAPVTFSVGAGATPWAIVINASGTIAYVLDNGLSTVIPVTIATNAVGAPINVGPTPLGLALTPDGQFLYVTNSDNGTISKISTTINEVVDTIELSPGAVPLAIAIQPNGTLAYVTADFPDSTGVVVPLRLDTNALGTPILVGQSPFNITLAPGLLPNITNLEGTLKQNIFLNNTQSIFTITGQTTDLSYRIYKKGILIATVSASEPLFFRIILRSPAEAQTFSIATKKANGSESILIPVPVTQA